MFRDKTVTQQVDIWVLFSEPTILLVGGKSITHTLLKVCIKSHVFDYFYEVYEDTLHIFMPMVRQGRWGRWPDWKTCEYWMEGLSIKLTDGLTVHLFWKRDGITVEERERGEETDRNLLVLLSLLH